VKQSVRLTLEAQGRAEDIDLPQNAQNTQMMRNLFSLTVGASLGTEMFDTAAQHYTLQHRHAAVVIYRTVLKWRRMKQKHKLADQSPLKQRSNKYQATTPHEEVAGWDASSANGLKRLPVSTSEAASQTPKAQTSESNQSQRPNPALEVLDKVQSGAVTRQLPTLPQMGGTSTSDAASLANSVEEDPSEAADSLL